MPPPPDILLFTYPGSPYGRLVSWYLTLRRLPHRTCTQPAILPRPTLAALDIHYRQIPILAIGRDIYVDTRLILAKLESRHPEGALSSPRPEHVALVKLIDAWLQGSVFAHAARMIPPDAPVVNSPAFVADRFALAGIKYDRASQEAERASSWAQLRDALALVEDTLLGDGRTWVLETGAPALADLKLLYVLDWLRELGAASVGYDAAHYPRVFAWMARLRARIDAAREGQRVEDVGGEEAVKHVLGCEFAEQGGRVDEEDPLGLVMGEQVSVHTSFSKWHDSGTLVDLTPEEVTVGVRPTVDPSTRIHVHYPRVGTRIYRGPRAQGKL